MSHPSKTGDRKFLHELLKQPEILKIIVNSLAETIVNYAKFSVVAGKPIFRDGSQKRSIAVAGLIRFDGPQLSIELMLGFSQDLFLALYENMFQMPVQEITEENQDLAGEILNIAFGVMDPSLKKQGFELRSSFPIIYVGQRLNEVLAKISAEAIVIPYSHGSKVFEVEIYGIDGLQQDWKYDAARKVA